jgi:phosphate transport system permease protein
MAVDEDHDTERAAPPAFGEVSRVRDAVFEGVTLGATLVGIVSLGVLLVYVAVDAFALFDLATDAWLDVQFLTDPPHPDPFQAGFRPAIMGSVGLIVLIALITFPLGVGAAIYLEEYAHEGPLVRFVQLNIANLAGVPSVVYGLLGLGLFVSLLGLGFGTLIVAGFTVSLLVLPIVIIAAQEAIRAVPDSQRQASYGMGATKWQTVRNVVLPRALPGILTGTILALGRAIGETAPLIMIGAANVTFSIPTSLTDGVSAMPMQVFTWATSAKLAFQDSVLAAGVVTMVVVLLVINSVAIVLRNTYQTNE